MRINMKPLVAPSLLSADFLNLGRDIEMINRSEADWLHLDIMDGVFVPNISFGFPLLSRIRKATTKPMDVHLMIVDPDRYIERFRSVGADIITVHYEACNHLHRTIQAIKATGAQAGISLNPHTPVALLKDIIQEINLVLIMSVNPGFGGQKFIRQSLQKIAETHSMIDQTGSTAMIEVDGGVNLENAPQLVQAGTNILVAGNTVFQSKNPEETIHALKNC